MSLFCVLGVLVFLFLLFWPTVDARKSCHSRYDMVDHRRDGVVRVVGTLLFVSFHMIRVCEQDAPDDDVRACEISYCPPGHWPRHSGVCRRSSIIRGNDNGRKQ